MRCPFQIKYKIKGTRLIMMTRAQHEHEIEIRKRGLPVAKAAAVQKMATSMPTGSIISFKILNRKSNLHRCAVVKPRQLHIEINSATEVHISPTKQNVRSLRHMVKRERDRKAVEVLGKRIPSTFEAFEEYFQSILMKPLMDGHNSGDPSKHLTLDQMICCGMQVDAEANIMFAVVSTVNLLLKIGQLNGTHRKYIRNEDFIKDEEEGFTKCIQFISRQTNENFVEVLQDKLIEKLEMMGEDRAVKWVQGTLVYVVVLYFYVTACDTENWSGDNGRYTLAHSKGPGGR